MWENAYLSIKNPKAFRALSRPWTQAANCSLCSHNSASLHWQLSASEPGTLLDQILDPHLGCNNTTNDDAKIAINDTTNKNGINSL